jgi:protease II
MYGTASVLNAEEKEEGDSEVDNKEYSLPIRCIRPRETGVRYEVEHHDLTFYFVTNKDNAKNKKLVFAPVSDYFPPPSSEERRVTQVVQWKDVRAYDQCEQIEDILPFRDFVAIFGRKKGIQQLWIMDVTNPGSTSIPAL